MTTPIFVDVETTGLGQDARVWEIAAITADGSSWHAAWAPDLAGAELQALALNRLVQRHADGELGDGPGVMHVKAFASWLRAAKGDLGGPLAFAGASVHFDAQRLHKMAADAAVGLPVSHRLLDVCTYTAVVFVTDAPCSLRSAATAAGVDYDPDAHHGALYDAWLAREVYGCAHYALHGRWPDGWAHVAWIDGGRLEVPT